MANVLGNRCDASLGAPARFSPAFLAVFFLLSLPAAAEPWMRAGDPWLRSDVLLLADAGIVTSPVSGWPLSWGDIAQDLNAYADAETLTGARAEAFERLRVLAAEALVVGEIRVDAGAVLSERPIEIRGFADTPRGDQELWVASRWTGERFALGARVSASNNDAFDDDELRWDGSYAAVALGNWIVGASVLDRWWGPGWNGSLILSNSARPIPAFVIERNFSTPFASRWLRWIGPWSTSLIWGQLENERAVPNARFFGWRVNFKPLPSLEIGLLRTAQWCGSGRQCDLDAFVKVLAGDSNLDTGSSQDVANQLAGFDLRWASPIGTGPWAVYGQMIGEDEAGGFPSRYMGQFGVEAWGTTRGGRARYRAFAEFADSTCQFHESSRLYDCAYANSFYPDGYRYRDRAIGHATDGDSRSAALGVVVQDRDWGEFTVTARHMKINRGGSPQPAHSIAPNGLRITDFDVQYRRPNDFFDLLVGVGVERREALDGSGRDDNLRLSLGAQFRL